jgi:hypothetical protein
LHEFKLAACRLCSGSLCRFGVSATLFLLCGLARAALLCLAFALLPQFTLTLCRGLGFGFLLPLPLHLALSLSLGLCASFLPSGLFPLLLLCLERCSLLTLAPLALDPTALLIALICHLRVFVYK